MTQYSGKIIRKNAVVPTQQSASGVWTVTDAAAATRNNAWPVAGVPDPISRSVRFRSSASAYFNRTFGTPTNNLKWTMSMWMKRGTLNTFRALMAGNSGAGTSTNFALTFSAAGSNSAGDFFNYFTPNVGTRQFYSNAVYRDSSAWYHVVFVFDSANATQANRSILYINGVQQSGTNNVALNQICHWNESGKTGFLGYFGSSFAGDERDYFDGYLTEVNFIDGQALTPSSFGTTDAFTGAWVPMAYIGTYGTNGFYLNFKDNTSTTTLGYDYSGNSNNWTANNISLTAGSTYDSMLDVPTPWIGYNTDGGVSVTRGNYCTINPLDYTGSGTVSQGNLYYTGGGSGVFRSTIGADDNAGKFYFEITQQTTVNSSNPIIYGWASLVGAPSHSAPQRTALLYCDGATGHSINIYNNGSLVTQVNCNITSIAIGDILQFAYDATSGKVWVGKNNSWCDASGGSTGNPSTGANPVYTFTLANQPLTPTFDHAGVAYQASLNCGQRPFSYTPPTGYKALCTTNLPEPTIKLGASYMAASTFTGTGAALSIVNSGNNTTATTFQPDFVWLKNRTIAYSHLLADSVRGATKYLVSSSVAAEATDANSLTAFNSNGFSVGPLVDINGSGNAIVAWQWKANGSAVSNTNGTITSQVNAGTTQGFSVVTWTNNGSANQSVGHGLGVTPSMIITKDRTNGTFNWATWFTGFSKDEYLLLNTTGAKASYNTLWYSVPDSTKFYIGSTGTGLNNGTDQMVAYCFAEVAGYSKFGSYTGNGSADGPFVYCGFRPRYVMVKGSSGATNWFIWDSSRDTYNVANKYLLPNSSSAEDTTSGEFDILSNGFKFRANNQANSSGATYIFAAFAETPFKFSNAR